MYAKQPRWQYQNATSEAYESIRFMSSLTLQFSLDSSHQPDLMDVITTLFADRSPLSIGSTVVAFEGVCPTRLDLLHKHYRRLCKTLIEVDEWGQVTLTNVLLRYARTMLTKPTDGEIDSDVKLLLTSVEPLFLSINPAVCDSHLCPTTYSLHVGSACGCSSNILSERPIVSAQTRSSITAIARTFQRN